MVYKPHIKRIDGLWQVVHAGPLDAMNHRAWRWCWRMNSTDIYFFRK